MHCSVRFPFSSFRWPCSSNAPDVALCDLVIPVFNRPDLLRDLLESIRLHTDTSLLGRVWIGDDASDRFTSRELKRILRQSRLPVTLIRHQQNVGFGANCNALLDRVERPYAVLLNTDVRLPPGWLPRILAPLQADSTIALATPLATNAANHTIRLQSGQSWREVDRILSAQQPRFPDACTAIGFCMAMHVDVLRDKNLCSFDPAFGRGYGEDTDLHYRVTTEGLRSVIVDNLFVHHIGGATFDTLKDVGRIRTEGRDLFFKRWGEIHRQAHEAYERSKPLDRLIEPSSRALRFPIPLRRIDVLFVLPSTHLRYGGVWVVCQIVQAMIERGYSAAVYVKDTANLLADTTRFGFRVFEGEESLLEHVQGIGCVVSTADTTIQTASALAKRFGATEAIMLQCMEVAFRTGLSIRTYQEYRRIPHVVTVSQALTDYIRLINPVADVHTLPFGPDPLFFYPRNEIREQKTIAIAINDIPEKGFTHALEPALMLRDRGYRLTFFGWEHEYPVPPEIGTVVHDTSREALAQLFSRAEFLLDHSYLEGLGLIPLEAAFCGCIPIIGAKGGAEYIFQDRSNCIRLTGYRSLASTLDDIIRLSQSDVARLRAGALELRKRIGLSQALSMATDVFARLAHS